MPYTHHSYFHSWSTPATPSWLQPAYYNSRHDASRLADPTFEHYAKAVKKDLVSLDTWADELPRLRRRCDELYEQAKTAQGKGEYDRAQRRLSELRKVLRAIDGEWKGYGLGGSAREAKVYFG
tara:strand:- start:16931 stop:17299 length:369 start_codon:yes stop_codon:yes gene_type:complete